MQAIVDKYDIHYHWGKWASSQYLILKSFIYILVQIIGLCKQFVQANKVKFMSRILHFNLGHFK